MGINKPSLQPSQKIFTKKDFLDGKCTKDGLPLGSQPIDERPLAPADAPPPEQPEVPTETSAPEPETVTHNEPVEEQPSGDTPDSEESPDDSDGQEGSGEEVNPTPA
jgi:hypothetical protein